MNWELTITGLTNAGHQQEDTLAVLYAAHYNEFAKAVNALQNVIGGHSRREDDLPEWLRDAGDRISAATYDCAQLQTSAFVFELTQLESETARVGVVSQDPDDHHEDCDYRNSYAAREAEETFGLGVTTELHDCNLSCGQGES